MINKSKVFVTIFVAISLLFLSILTIGIGSVDFTLNEIIGAIFNGETTTASNIIRNIRIPRVIVAIFIGANLAVSGALLQAVMQNPLADPGLTGVSSGASFAAVIVIILYPHLFYILPIVAFVGGAIACAITYTLAWNNGINPIRIILSGVAVNAVFGGLTALMYIFYSDRVQHVLQWTNGSTIGKTWSDVTILVIYSTIGLIISLFCIRYANILQLGDKMATNLGVNTSFYRIVLSIVSVMLASISVSITGPIGFVGLVVPHIARLIVGSDYKYLLPFSIVSGSLFLLIADTVARTILNPIEIPVGIVMALCGAPFFLYLLRKGGKSRA